jgi:hypothetical protein
MPRDIGVCLLG